MNPHVPCREPDDPAGAVASAFARSAGLRGAEAETLVRMHERLIPELVKHLNCPEDEAAVGGAALVVLWHHKPAAAPGPEDPASAPPPEPDRKKDRAALRRAGKYFERTAAGDPSRLALAIELFVEARLLPPGKPGCPPSWEASVLWRELAWLWRRAGDRVPRGAQGPFFDFVKDVHKALGLPDPRGGTVQENAPALNLSAERRLRLQGQLAALRGIYEPHPLD